MIKKTLTLALLLLGFGLYSHAQQRTILLEINEVYSDFLKSYSTLDADLFAKVHSEKIIRVPSASRILNYEDYMNEQKSFYEDTRKNGGTWRGELRFYERIFDETRSSDRGIYKFIMNEGKDDEQVFYGAFHVLVVKVDGAWKFLLDYDTSEGVTINEEHYLKAYALDDIDRFVKE